MSNTFTTGGGRSDYKLPTVNANDNGKVLKVVEGEWKKAEGGSGGILVANATRTDSSLILDKTFGELWSAREEGIVVFIQEEDGSESDNTHSLGTCAIMNLTKQLSQGTLLEVQLALMNTIGQTETWYGDIGSLDNVSYNPGGDE